MRGFSPHDSEELEAEYMTVHVDGYSRGFSPHDSEELEAVL